MVTIKTWLKGDLPICLKRKLLDSVILPTLSYGSQTLSLTANQMRRIKVCQRAMALLERTELEIKN